MLDSLDLDHARTNEIQLRTDALVQNAKTTDFNNNWKSFKFDFKPWNHSHPTHPWKNPDDETQCTNLVEVMNRVAKDEFLDRHRTIENCRGCLSVYEFKHNENVRDQKSFGKGFFRMFS